MPRRASFGDRRLQDAERMDVLEPKIDVSRGRFGGEATDQNAFDQLMRIKLEKSAIIEGRRLTLIAVDAHERFLPILRQE
jgi:hypothetical protein